jgi:hypothetical protein
VTYLCHRRCHWMPSRCPRRRGAPPAAHDRGAPPVAHDQGGLPAAHVEVLCAKLSRLNAKVLRPSPKIEVFHAKLMPRCSIRHPSRCALRQATAQHRGACPLLTEMPSVVGDDNLEQSRHTLFMEGKSNFASPKCISLLLRPPPKIEVFHAKLMPRCSIHRPRRCALRQAATQHRGACLPAPHQDAFGCWGWQFGTTKAYPVYGRQK